MSRLNNMSTYELTFEGELGLDGERFPRYRRRHKTLESAEAEALRVRDELQSKHDRMDGGTTTASHTPQIYHPSGRVSTVPWT